MIKRNRQETTNKQTSNSLVQDILLGTRKQDLSHVVRINLIDYAVAACAKYYIYARIGKTIRRRIFYLAGHVTGPPHHNIYSLVV